MNLFGLNVEIAKKNNSTNNKFVKKDDCHSAMESIDNRLTEVKDFLNTRITDLCGKVDTVVTLLKK